MKALLQQLGRRLYRNIVIATQARIYPKFYWRSFSFWLGIYFPPQRWEWNVNIWLFGRKRFFHMIHTLVEREKNDDTKRN